MISNFRVEKAGGGDFTSIGEAQLAAQKMNGQVVVTLGGGSYEEILEFTSPNISFLAGPDCTPILIGKEHGVIVSESVRFVGIRFSAPQSHIPAVTVVSKSPQFEKCTIEHLRVDLKGSPIVTSSTFSGSATTGLSFAGVSGGLVDSCTFLSNRLYGILVEGSSSPTIRGCSLTMSGRGAVVLCGQSHALVADCNIQDSTGLGDARPVGMATKLTGSTCDRAGIVVGNTATPIIRGNTIFSCSGHGIAIFGATYSPMKLSERKTISKRSNAPTETSSKTSIEGNTIRSNNGLGLFVAASVPQLLLKGNSITENTMGGAVIASCAGFTRAEVIDKPSSARSRCELVNNNMLDNGKFGLCVSGRGTHVDIVDSKIEGHPEGVRCTDDCVTVIRNCRIQRCEVAVVCVQRARATIASSTLFDNKEGVVTESYASADCTDVILEANTIGLALRKSGVGRIAKCTFKKNGIGIFASLGAQGRVHDCTISECDDMCVLSSTRASVHFSRNTIDGVSQLVVSKEGCKSHFEGNVFNVRGPCGVVLDGGDPTLTLNTFSLGPTSTGLELKSSSLGLLRSNTISGGSVGIRGHTGCHSTIRGNLITDAHTGIELLNGSLCTVDKNVIERVEVGLLVIGGSFGLPSLTANQLRKCSLGMSLRGGTETDWPKVHMNALIECATGIECTDSFAMVTRNISEECAVGTVIQGEGAPKLIGCTFTRCTEGGLSIRSNSKCVVISCQFLANIGAASRGVRGRFGVSLEGECIAHMYDCVFAFNDVGLFQQNATSTVQSTVNRCVFRRNYRGFIAEGSTQQLKLAVNAQGVSLRWCSFLGDVRGVLVAEGAVVSLTGCLFQRCGMGLSTPVYSPFLAVHANQCIFTENRLHISGMCTSLKSLVTNRDTIDSISTDDVAQIKGIVAQECVFYRGGTMDGTLKIEVPMLFLRCLFAGVGVAITAAAPTFVLCSFVGDIAPLVASLKCIGSQQVQLTLPVTEGDSTYRRQLLNQHQDTKRAVHITPQMYDDTHPPIALSCSGSSAPWIVCCSVSFYSTGIALSRTSACVVGSGISHTEVAMEIDDGFDGRVLHSKFINNYGPGISVKGRMATQHRPDDLAPCRGVSPEAASETARSIRQVMQLCGKETGKSCLFHVTIARSLLSPFSLSGVQVQNFQRETAFSGTEENPTESKDSHTPVLVVCQSVAHGGAGVLVHDSGSLYCDDITVTGCDVAGIVFDGSRGQLAKRHHLANSTISNCPFGVVLRPLVDGVELQSCVIHSCRAAGVAAEQGSRLTASKSVISGCSIGVLGVGDRAEMSHTLLLRNTICGLRLGGGSKTTLDDCDVVENGNGIETYHPSTTPHVQRTRIHNNNHMGVLISGESAPTIEQSHIYNHADQSGVLVRCGATPTIKNNIVERNASGIVCRLRASPNVTGNTVTNNRVGTLIEWFGSGVWSLNLYTSNTANSIVCRTGGDAFVTQNLLLNDTPIHVTMEGRGCFALNTMRAPKRQCIVVTRGGNPTILRTTFIGSQDHDLLPWGALSEEVDKGELLLTRCHKVPFALADAAAQLLQSVISEDDPAIRELPKECEMRPVQPLIEISEGGRGVFADCIFAAADCALLAHGPASAPTIDTCIFYRCDVGVHSLDGSLPECKASVFQLCVTAVLSTASSPSVNECLFDTNRAAFVSVGLGAPVLRGSSIRRCVLGVQLAPSSSIHILASTINTCNVGVVAQIGSTPTINDCTIHGGAIAGVVFDTMALSVFSNSTVSDTPIGVIVNGSRLCESSLTNITIVGSSLGLRVACSQAEEDTGMEYSWQVVREGLTDELQGAVRKKAGRHHEPIKVQSPLVYGCTILNCTTGASFEGSACRPLTQGLSVVGSTTGLFFVGGSPTIRTSTLLGCKTGIEITGESSTTIDSCLVAECTSGVVVRGSSPILLGTKILNSKLRGLLLDKDARGRMDRCEVANSAESDMVCDQGSLTEIGDILIRCHGKPEICVQMNGSAQSAIVGELRIEHCPPEALVNTRFLDDISSAGEMSSKCQDDGAARDALVAQQLRDHFQKLGVGTSECPSIRSLYEAVSEALDSINEGTGEGYGYYMLTPRARGALSHLLSLSPANLKDHLYHTTLSEFVVGTPASSNYTSHFSTRLCNTEEEFAASCGKLVTGSNPALHHTIRDIDWGAYPSRDKWEITAPSGGAQTVIDRLRMRAGDANPRRRMYASVQSDNSEEANLHPSPPQPRRQASYPRAHVQGLSSRHSAATLAGSTCLVPTAPSALASQCLQGMQVGLHGYGHSMKESFASTQEAMGTFTAAQLLQEFATIDARKRHTITYADLSRFIQRLVSQHSEGSADAARISGPVPNWAAEVAGEAFKLCNKNPYTDELTLLEFGTFISAPSRWRALLDEHFPWLRVSSQQDVLREQPMQ